MRVLIVESESGLGKELRQRIDRVHDVRTLDNNSHGETHGPKKFFGDPLDDEVAAAATSGCDAIVDLRMIMASPNGVDSYLLEAATRGTYNLLKHAVGMERYVLASSLQIFETYPIDWRVTEQWAPRPTTDVGDLSYYLSELVVREMSRVRAIKSICLRFAQIVTGEAINAGGGDPRWIHVKDATQAILRALEIQRAPTMHSQPPYPHPSRGWWVFHIPGGGIQKRFPMALAGQAPFAYSPEYAVAGDEQEIWTKSGVVEAGTEEGSNPGVRARSIKDVLVLGAAGPLGVAATQELAREHRLRLADIAPLEDFQPMGQPTYEKLARFNPPHPTVLGPPHECCVVDVRDGGEVSEATRGMDAIVNCTVVRHDPVEAFRVNTIGAFNIARSAVKASIKRIVQTGPQQVSMPAPEGYWYDFGIPENVPGRPGEQLYVLSKFLGHEILRIFAEEHGLEVPLLFFSRLTDPAAPPEEPFGAFPFTVSWQDGGRAINEAVRTRELREGMEGLHITADLPHGKYRNERAKELLRWEPVDSLEAHWKRSMAGN